MRQSRLFGSCDCGQLSTQDIKLPSMSKLQELCEDAFPAHIETHAETALEGQILEVASNDGMEISILSEDERLFSMESRDEKTSSVSAPPNKKNSWMAAFETPQKRRVYSDPVSTPETVPLDEEYSDHLDEISCDSRLQQPSDQEISIRIDDYRSTALPRLMRKLSKLQGLTKVELYRLREISNQRTRTTSEMACLFSTLRALPNLETLSLYNFNKHDLDLIAKMIKSHPTLQTFNLHFTSGSVNATFLETIAEAPILKNVSLDVQSSFELNLLLASKSIAKLTVPSETFRFEDDHFVAAMRALESNRTLRSLDLKPHLSKLGIRALSLGLQDNTCLETLWFSFLTKEEEAGESVLEFIRALAKNTSLRAVHNHYAKLLRLDQVNKYRCYDALQGREGTVDVFESSSDVNSMEDDMESANWMCGMEGCRAAPPSWSFVASAWQSLWKNTWLISRSSTGNH